jgi:hypothetical protein
VTGFRSCRALGCLTPKWFNSSNLAEVNIHETLRDSIAAQVMPMVHLAVDKQNEIQKRSALANSTLGLNYLDQRFKCRLAVSTHELDLHLICPYLCLQMLNWE